MADAPQLPDEHDLQAGKPVSASWFVAIVRWIKTLANIRGAAPIAVSAGNNGIVVSLTQTIQPPFYFGKANANASAATVDGSGYVTAGTADVTVYGKDSASDKMIATDRVIKNVANYSGVEVTGGDGSDSSVPVVGVVWDAQYGQYVFVYQGCGMPYAST